VAIVLDVVLDAVTGMSGIAEVVLDAAVKGVVILLVAYGSTWALRNASAASRHLVWSAAVVGILALPAARLVAPEWRVPGTSLLLQTEPAVDHGPAVDARPQRATTSAIASRPPQQQNATPSQSGGLAAAQSEADRRAGSPFVGLEGAEGVNEPLDWRHWVSLGWLVGAVAVLSWIVAGLVRAQWLARSATVITVGPLADLVGDLAEELDLNVPVTLLQSRRSVMPMTWGLRAKILLPRDADEWTDARLKAVLLHELAHVKRFDYETQLLARLATVLYWFNPLVWIAARKMRVERELACDDRVLNTGSRASDYASHLLDIARSMKTGVFMSVSGIAMARRSHLPERLLAVLDARRSRTGVSRKVAVAAWGGAACFVFPIAGAVPGAGEDLRLDSAVSRTTTITKMPVSAVVPAAEAYGEIVASIIPSEAVQGCDWYAREGGSSTSMQVNDNDVQIRIKRGDCRLEIEILGELEFNDAETEVIGITRGGYFEIEESEGRARRRIEMELREDGSLERRWFVNGDEQPYGDAASDWLAGMIPLLFRRAGLQAEERAERILARSGVEGLLQEISLIPSDHTARTYYRVLLTQADLDESQIRQIVRQAGAEIDSDYELAQLLIDVAELHPVDEAVMVAYVEAAGSIDSDYEQRRVLDAILTRNALSLDVYRAMLELATDIDSDYELGELLIGLLDNRPLDETLTLEFFAALATLDSDYEHRRVLQVVLKRGASSQVVLDLALESAVRFESDYELAELLIEIGQLYPTDRTIPDAYLDAATSLDSDYELHRVLSVRIARGDLQPAALDQVLDVAASMDSDHELAELLIVLTDIYEVDDAMRSAYFRVVGSLDSDYERTRVLRKLLEVGDLNEETVAAVLHSALDIDSDYELASLLVGVSETYRINERLRQLYLDAANQISSRYERNRALAALAEGGGL
jgi:beta-lactamase regulating signal transducer with metallopeptidase domain